MALNYGLISNLAETAFGAHMESLTKVKFTHLEKVLFPELKITKHQFIEYIIKMAPRMLPFLQDRPIVLTRYPEGAEEQGFYAKNAPMGIPNWVKTAKIYSDTVKRDVNYIICNDLDTLLWIANLDALEIHMPLSRIDALDKPDFAFFDIDPEPPATFQQGASVALLLYEKLQELGLTAYVKTRGKKGFMCWCLLNGDTVLSRPATLFTRWAKFWLRIPRLLFQNSATPKNLEPSTWITFRIMKGAP
jgi:DNA ligase D-like protein (predicted polymerase)